MFRVYALVAHDLDLLANAERHKCAPHIQGDRRGRYRCHKIPPVISHIGWKEHSERSQVQSLDLICVQCSIVDADIIDETGRVTGTAVVSSEFSGASCVDSRSCGRSDG